MQIDPNGPGFISETRRSADRERIALAIKSGVKIKKFRPKAAKDLKLKKDERDTLNPAYVRLPR